MRGLKIAGWIVACVFALAAGALLLAWRQRTPADRLLLVVVAFVVLFFSISTEKRDLYVLPAYPAFALLTGRLVADAVAGTDPERAERVGGEIGLVAGVAKDMLRDGVDRAEPQRALDRIAGCEEPRHLERRPAGVSRGRMRLRERPWRQPAGRQLPVGDDRVRQAGRCPGLGVRSQQIPAHSLRPNVPGRPGAPRPPPCQPRLPTRLAAPR